MPLIPEPNFMGYSESVDKLIEIGESDWDVPYAERLHVDENSRAHFHVC
jgi:hypothetical protein